MLLLFTLSRCHAASYCHYSADIFAYAAAGHCRLLLLPDAADAASRAITPLIASCYAAAR